MCLSHEGKAVAVTTLSTLVPASPKQVATAKTKMVISSRSNYPVRDGFPRALEKLAVNHCLLRKIDSRILRLSLLVSMDLSDNHIRQSYFVVLLGVLHSFILLHSFNL